MIFKFSFGDEEKEGDEEEEDEREDREHTD